MSLLTGAPRTATAVAVTEIEVVRVAKNAFASVVLADHGIANRLSDLLAERLAGTAQLVASASRAGGDQHVDAAHVILERIRRFFGLDEAPEE
jgi:CRP-like cAMP-binding protein